MKITPLIIAAGGNIHDPNIVLLPILEYPVKTVMDVLGGDASGPRELYKYNVRVWCKTAVKAIRKRTVAGSDDRCHHAMPTRYVRLEKRRDVAVVVEHVPIRQDAVCRRRQIDVGIKA